jgi:hypothetical protein
MQSVNSFTGSARFRTVLQTIRNAGLAVVVVAVPGCVASCRKSAQHQPIPRAMSSTTTHPLLTTSITAHYPLNETTGSIAADATGNNNPATFTSPVPLVPPRRRHRGGEKLS